jgi:hypothetical protein
MIRGKKNAITFFKGPIKVQDGAFDLYAERFIPRIQSQDKKEIAFSFVGIDYRVEGVAAYDKKHKFFMAPKLKLLYNNFDPQDTINIASVRIDYVELDLEKDTAYFEGLWIEDGNYWQIKGRLKKGTIKKKPAVKPR